MQGQEKIRIDKWLWAVRIFKTRTLAADACDRGRIKIKGLTVKAGRTIKVGEIIVIHTGPCNRHFKVMKLTAKRSSSALAKENCEDVTPAEELQKLELYKAALAALGPLAKGRPTKKDRRALEYFLDMDIDW